MHLFLTAVVSVLGLVVVLVAELPWLAEPEALVGLRIAALYDARAQLAPGITFSSTATFNSEQNNDGFSSETYSQLARATATETDPQKLKQVYTQMNDLLLDEAFATAVASAPPRMLLKSNVQGLGYTMHEGFDWTNVWLSW